MSTHTIQGQVLAQGMDIKIMSTHTIHGQVLKQRMDINIMLIIIIILSSIGTRNGHQDNVSPQNPWTSTATRSGR